jgi:hypothetical protein
MDRDLVRTLLPEKWWTVDSQCLATFAHVWRYIPEVLESMA